MQPLPLPDVAHVLLMQMAVVKCVVQCHYPAYRWTARAVGCDLWGNGPTACDAMRKALEMKCSLSKR